ncbi:MAG: nucleotidyltransferase family protein, partial [Candidatus Omnitrophica bacterium]|nr:nucleotidyltransferase family protein [Candidatus Omnitrophota bacterium]
PQFKKWKARRRISTPITVVDDLTVDNVSRRGAIGDTDFAIDAAKIRENLVVLGGDNLFDGGLSDFLRYARQKATPVMGVYNIDVKEKASQYGVVKLDAQQRVVDFQEKPAKPKSTYIAMCLYYFPQKKLGLIKEYIARKNQSTDATGSYIDWLRTKVPVYGYVFGGRWFDIGDHKFYNAAKQAFRPPSPS